MSTEGGAKPEPGPSTSEKAKHMTFTGRPKRFEYEQCEKALAAFFAENAVDVVGRMATVSSFLRHHFPRNFFCGFYTVVAGADSRMLQIGPYTGNGSVLASGLIAFTKGQCGTCAASGETQIVADVRTCSNYIACDEDSLSEIVVPVFARRRHDEPPSAAPAPERRLIAVLDIDADVVGAYDEVDKECLERIVARFFE